MSHWVSTGVSSAYRAFRPEYPRALFQEVLSTALASAGLKSPAPAAGQSQRPPFTVIDLGCGTGQATFGLADALLASSKAGASTAPDHPTVVIGVDPSATQVAEAVRAAAEAGNARFRDAGVSIQFAQGSAESLHATLQDVLLRSTASPAAAPAAAVAADLVLVAQAVHWMDIPSLCASLVDGGRVNADDKSKEPALLREGGVFALVSYPTSTLALATEPLDSPGSMKVNALLQALDTRLAEGQYWPPERAHLVEPNVYAHIRPQIDQFRRPPVVATAGATIAEPEPTAGATTPLAFTPLPRRVYRERRTLSVEHLMKYLGTWSGVNRYIAATGDVALLARDVEEPMRKILAEATEGISDSPHTDSIDVTFTFYLDMWRRN